MISTRSAVFAAIVACLVALRLFNSATANASYVLLAAYALLGRSNAIQALALACLFNMINPAIAPEATGSTVGRFLILFAAAFSSALHGGFLGGKSSIKLKSTTFLTILLGVVLLIHSLFVSPLVDVSALKVISWTLAITTSIACWTALDRDATLKLENQLFFSLVALMLVSIPFLGVPTVGYLVNGTGFQGVLAHPQTFGPVMALLSAWTFARTISMRTPSWALLGIFATTLPLIVLSEARTAGVAMTIGVLASIIVTPILSGRQFRVEFPGLFSIRMYATALAVLVAVISSSSLLLEQVSEYMIKRNSASSGLADAYESSRGGLITAMLENIEETPLFGIGFGIASNVNSMDVSRDPLFNLPTGATIEKGVLPIAIIEEVGFVVGLCVFGWMGLFIYRSARGGAASVAVGATILLLNMGEATFFSPGGLGLFLLVLAGWAFASQKTR